MKPIYFLTLIIISACSFAHTQRNFEDRFASIQNELNSWDVVRGSWLSSSLLNLSNNQAVPDRTFPEDFTPHEMIKALPNDVRARITDSIQSNLNAQPEEAVRWNYLNRIIERVGCSYILGRSYGDPHLSSFDGANYSFQTVGEFVLVKSNSSNLEVQCRQQPQNDNFSLNTAVAMNVAGDRLAIYAEDKPDFNPSPIRLNGNPIQLAGRTYYLPNGGNIRLTGRNYIITYPTGEIVNIEMRQSGIMSFLNVSVQVFDCDRNNFTGLLGNANRNTDDDFNGNNNRNNLLSYSSVFGSSSISKHAEKEYLAFLAGTFAEEWRVNQSTTLFDYGMGQSTLTFTDRSFPRIHYTIDDLTPDQMSNARRNCEERGVLVADMRGCIFDQGFLNISPNPIPSNPDFTQGVVFKPIERPALNTNQFEFAEGKNPTNGNALPIKPNENNNPGKGIGEKEMPKEFDKNPGGSSIIDSKPDKIKPSSIFNPVKTPASPKISNPNPVSTPTIKGLKGKN
jgi:hypothetical protein